MALQVKFSAEFGYLRLGLLMMDNTKLLWWILVYNLNMLKTLENIALCFSDMLYNQAGEKAIPLVILLKNNPK